jgi:hypothetical protein
MKMLFLMLGHLLVTLARLASPGGLRKCEQAEADAALGLQIRNHRRIVDRPKGITDLNLVTW